MSTAAVMGAVLYRKSASSGEFKSAVFPCSSSYRPTSLFIRTDVFS